MPDPIFIVAPQRSGGALLAEALQSDRVRVIDVSPQDATPVAALHSEFPNATFVYIYREPRRAVLDVDAGMNAEDFAREWNASTSALLDDLERLPAGAWMVVAYHELVEHPAAAIPRIASFLGLPWDGRTPRAPLPFEPPPAETRAQLDDVDKLTRTVADRARDLFAAVPPRAVAFRSSATQSFPNLLRQLGISLCVSTYQSGRLILLRAENASTLNTHFRMFRSPMGIAVGSGRIAVGTEREVWDYRNVPALKARLDPPGKHDACFVPRKVHVTGDIRIHEIGFAAGELWMVNTRFSALCTLDADSSFVPRWRPPFITRLAAEDRCHLNGMAIVGDRVRYVTALGATDTAGGWRENKARGGLLLDVDSGETVLHGLSMPHSPRLYNGRFYFLESGKGTIATADLVSGHVETIAELPGFTRGLAFAGPFAFVGLSQVRESNIFGGIPLTERVAERECGVYAIDLRTGRTAAFLRFDGDVREIFDVQVLHASYPELLELSAPEVATSYSVPDEMLAQFAAES